MAIVNSDRPNDNIFLSSCSKDCYQVILLPQIKKKKNELYVSQARKRTHYHCRNAVKNTLQTENSLGINIRNSWHVPEPNLLPKEVVKFTSIYIAKSWLLSCRMDEKAKISRKKSHMKCTFICAIEHTSVVISTFLSRCILSSYLNKDINIYLFLNNKKKWIQRNCISRFVRVCASDSDLDLANRKHPVLAGRIRIEFLQQYRQKKNPQKESKFFIEPDFLLRQIEEKKKNSN